MTSYWGVLAFKVSIQGIFFYACPSVTNLYLERCFLSEPLKEKTSPALLSIARNVEPLMQSDSSCTRSQDVPHEINIPTSLPAMLICSFQRRRFMLLNELPFGNSRHVQSKRRGPNVGPLSSYRKIETPPCVQTIMKESNPEQTRTRQGGGQMGQSGVQSATVQYTNT